VVARSSKDCVETWFIDCEGDILDVCFVVMGTLVGVG
jgi:hypothetical protein